MLGIPHYANPNQEFQNLSDLFGGPVIPFAASRLPENQRRRSLRQELFRMLDEMSSLIGALTDSYVTTPGMQRGWVIFGGACVEGKNHFFFHIVEGFATAFCRNTCDPEIAQNPFLLIGHNMEIRNDVLAAIKAKFPAIHSDLPFQAAFKAELVRTQLPAGDLVGVVNGTCTAKTPSFNVDFLPPSGTGSLSFTQPGFPIEFWTHLSRAAVIHTAHEREADPAKKALFKIGCDLEKALTDLGKEKKELEKNLVKKDESIDKLVKLINRNSSQPRFPAADKQRELAELQIQRDEIAQEIDSKENEIQGKSEEISLFKSTYENILPGSYCNATFQIAFAGESGPNRIYKQFDGVTGHMIPAIDVNPTDPQHPRFGDNVHNPYITW